MNKKKFEPLAIKPPKSREERRYEAKEREYSKLESLSDRILADLVKSIIFVDKQLIGDKN
jgi:hypothetical protein